MLIALICSMFIGVTDTQAASYPIGSLKYPIGTYTSDFSDTTNLYLFNYIEPCLCLEFSITLN